MAFKGTIVSANDKKLKINKLDAVENGSFVIVLSEGNQSKLLNGEEFEQDVDIANTELRNNIIQKTNLKGFVIAFVVHNGATIFNGEVIGNILQDISEYETRSVLSVLLANGQFASLTIVHNSLNNTFLGHIKTALVSGGGGNIVAFSNVAFDQDDTATLEVSEEQFEILKGEDNVVVVLELASGDVVTLYRTKHDDDLVSFGSVYGTTDGTDKKGYVYFANFSNSGSTIVGKAYEMEMGAGLTATVDETNKTINIVLG